MSLSTRIILFVIAALVGCGAMIGIFAYRLELSEVIKANGQRALAIARTVSAAAEPEEFEQVMATYEPTEHYIYFKDFLDKTMAGGDILYLYVVDVESAETIIYYAEGIDRRIDDGHDEILLGETEDPEVFPEEFFTTAATGVETITAVYDLGGYGAMLSAFSPLLDRTGRVLGVVGVDLPIDSALDAARRFGVTMLLMIAVICTAVMLLLVFFVRKYISKPVSEIKEAANQLAQGDTDIVVRKHRGDEIGSLADSIASMISGAGEQSRLIERLAGCDLTVDVKPRGTNDTVNLSLAEMANGLNHMMTEIMNCITQVSASSRQVANSSQSVAQGSAEQASSVDELSAVMQTLLESITRSEKMAKDAAALSGSAKDGADRGTDQMSNMLSAIDEINEAGVSISKVMKVIDDIAFQTNILALNAAVEAARAGAHGKGFAVVAEEVRSLATKSAEAARDSERLISDSIEKAAEGTRIANETAESLRSIVESIKQSTGIVQSIAEISTEQLRSTDEINKAIREISHVVQNNNASAEESAAASEQMSGQADILYELISRFKLK